MNSLLVFNSKSSTFAEDVQYQIYDSDFLSLKSKACYQVKLLKVYIVFCTYDSYEKSKSNI